MKHFKNDFKWFKILFTFAGRIEDLPSPTGPITSGHPVNVNGQNKMNSGDDDKEKGSYYTR
jgi:hypothetical protein